MNITILGGGSFGTALAVTWNDKHNIKIWEFLEKRVNIVKSKYCPWLDIDLPELSISNNLEQQLQDAELIVLAVPSAHAVSTIKNASKWISEDVPILIASKGFTPEGTLLSKSIILPNSLAILSGPSIAKEVVRNVKTAVNIASESGIRNRLCDELATEYFSCIPSEDIIGTQLGGLLKNIYAIWAGITDGLGVGMNTKALLLTKSLQEMKLLGKIFDAKEITFDNLSGIGDLIVTCASPNSRNNQLGKLLLTQPLEAALKKMEMVAEGVETTKHANKIAQQHNITIPLARELENVFTGKDARAALMEALQ